MSPFDLLVFTGKQIVDNLYIDVAHIIYIFNIYMLSQQHHKSSNYKVVKRSHTLLLLRCTWR